ncbi:unnamed protein product [Rotaria sordida]|uniref:Uncharacterized protein n=1 Tax=Rotaria sordida TaxID=392033 RepID=A0A820FSJ4_9BILA|nr:unnamed protein product [Rotaria sordida]
MTVLSSDSETSDNELQRPRRGNTIDMQDSNYEGSNLNNTVVSNMINEINELTDQNIQNRMLHMGFVSVVILSSGVSEYQYRIR